MVPVPIENRFNHPKAEVVCLAGANQPQPCLMVLLSEEARDELGRGRIADFYNRKMDEWFARNAKVIWEF